MSKTIIKVSVKDQSLALVTRPTLAAGGINENVIQFYFDESWVGYTKTAFFLREGIEPIPVLVVGIESEVPDEVVQSDGEFEFYVLGSGENTKTTERISFEVQKGAVVSSNAPLIPTPDIYSQIVNLSVEANAISKEVQKEFNSGVVPALRDKNTGAKFSVWTGPLNEYLQEKESFENGVLAIIDDQYGEYLVSKNDSTTKYSGGTAESTFRYTINNVAVNTSEGSLYKSEVVHIPFPAAVKAIPFSCTVNIIGTSNDGDVVFLATSGDWSATQTQGLCFVSPTSKDSITVRVEVKAWFKWNEE